MHGIRKIQKFCKQEIHKNNNKIEIHSSQHRSADYWAGDTDVKELAFCGEICY